MANWKSININANQVKAETCRSVLINMPHGSDYDGWCFWHPAKLVREGRHSAALSLSYTDEFVFRLKKYGHGRYDWNEVLAEKEIGPEELEAAFCKTDGNIRAPEPKNPYETHRPAAVEPVKAEVAAELKEDGE